MANIDQYFIHYDYRNYLIHGLKSADGLSTEEQSGQRINEIQIASQQLKSKWFNSINKRAKKRQTFTKELEKILKDSRGDVNLTGRLEEQYQDQLHENVFEQISVFLNSQHNANLTGKDVATLLGSETTTTSNVRQRKGNKGYSYTNPQALEQDLDKLYKRIGIILQSGTKLATEERKGELKKIYNDINSFLSKNRAELQKGSGANKNILQEAAALIYNSGQNYLGSKTIGSLAEYISPFVIAKDAIQKYGYQILEDSLLKGDKESLNNWQLSPEASNAIANLKREINKEKKRNLQTDGEEQKSTGVKDINTKIKLTETSKIITDVSIDVELISDKNLRDSFKKASKLKNLNISMKNYKNRTNVTLVSTNLLGILNVGPADFAAHYLNFLGGHRRKSKDKSSISFEHFNKELNLLLAVRGLLGVKSFSDGLDRGAQVFKDGSSIGVNEYVIVNDKSVNKFFVYSVYDILSQMQKKEEKFNAVTTGNDTNMPKGAGAFNKWFGSTNGFDKDPKTLTYNFLANASARKIVGHLNYTMFD